MAEAIMPAACGTAQGGIVSPPADYEAFILRRRPRRLLDGIAPPPDISPHLFPYQGDCLDFALRAGRSAAFLWTGLGKSLLALEWSRIVARHTGKPVLILTPLAVAAQFVREGRRFGIEARHVREAEQVAPGINVANYERLDRFAAIDFGGVVLDEAGILKAFAGRTKQALIERFRHTPFRLSCTATPAPNDHLELGNQAEFLGVMPANEMIARWFINDTMNFGSYRLKKHAVQDFWDWVCSWASCVSSPSDLGHDDGPFRLPELVETVHRVSSDITADAGEALFRLSGISATNMHKEQRLSLPDRVERLAWLVKAEPGEPWLIWCNTDEQADALAATIPEAIEVRGSHPAEWKEDRLLAFAEGRARILITKPRLAGWGLNFQHCARMGFVALDFSYEAYFQAIRRCWRFGQKRPVHVHLISSDGEAAIFAAVRRKAEQHEEMRRGMREAVRRAQSRASEVRLSYSAPHAAPLPSWVRELPQ